MLNHLKSLKRRVFKKKPRTDDLLSSTRSNSRSHATNLEDAVSQASAQLNSSGSKYNASHDESSESAPSLVVRSTTGSQCHPKLKGRAYADVLHGCYEGVQSESILAQIPAEPCDEASTSLKFNLSLALLGFEAISRATHRSFTPSPSLIETMREAMVTPPPSRQATASVMAVIERPNTPAPVPDTQEDGRTGSDTAIELDGVAGPNEPGRHIWLKLENPDFVTPPVQPQVLPENPLVRSPPPALLLEDFGSEAPYEARPTLENSANAAAAVYPHVMPTASILADWPSGPPYMLSALDLENSANTAEVYPHAMYAASLTADSTQHANWPGILPNRLLRPETRKTLSSQGPNSPAFVPGRSPQKVLIDDYHTTCPTYAARSMDEFLPFRRPELPRKKSPAPHIVSGSWQTTHETHRRRSAPTSERKLIRLGCVSSVAGLAKYMVYNSGTADPEHILNVLRPNEMDNKLFSSRTNHLKIVQELGKRAHPGIAAFWNGGDANMGQTRDHIWYLEHLETGTLESWKGAIENTQMLQISHELVTALQHLHSQEVIHMDLHPRNVIIDVRGHCRIAHFDRAVYAGHQGPVLPYEDSAYTPPESRHPGNCEVNYAVDIWGLGVLLSELVAGELMEEVILNALERQQTLHDAAASRQFTQLIDDLLRADPRERLSAERALTTPYLEQAIVYAEYRQEPPFLRVARVPVMSGPIIGGSGRSHAYDMERLEDGLGLHLPQVVSVTGY